jgi:hypothetical protein
VSLTKNVAGIRASFLFLNEKYTHKYPITTGDYISMFNAIKRVFIRLGVSAPLSFDQQVWGAKSVIDLVQRGSQFLLADGIAGQSCYTAWLNPKSKTPVAIVVDSTGHATGPFPDDTKVKDCEPWKYPPKITCAQATNAVVKSGISEAWLTCTLKKTADLVNPVYTFTFSVHAPVKVDATTGKII